MGVTRLPNAARSYVLRVFLAELSGMPNPSLKDTSHIWRVVGVQLLSANFECPLR
jgi:hypothetical protein